MSAAWFSGAIYSRNLRILRIALVAILDAPQVAAIALGALQERHQVRNANHVERTADAIVVAHRHGQRHVAAVAAAGDHDPVGVEIVARGDPIQQCADVLVRPFAEHAVVELQERFAIAGRAAHVGIKHRHAQLVEVVVVAALKDRARLPLGAAVNVDDHRPLAAEAGRRAVEEAGNLPAVERRPLHQLRLDERAGVEPAGFADRPAIDAARGQIERIDVRRRMGRRDHEAQLAAVLVPLQIADHAGRQLGHAQLAVGRGVEQPQAADAVFVGDESQPMAVERKPRAFHVPGNRRRQIVMAFRFQVEPRQPHELRLAIGEHVDRVAVAGKGHRLVGDFFRAAFGGDERLRPAGDVDQPDVALVDRNPFQRQHPLIVVRPVDHHPAAAGVFAQQLVAARLGRVHEVEVDVVLVALVEP